MKPPASPLTPPVRPMLFLPFSCTFSVMSTVASCTFCLISESCSGLSTSKYCSWFKPQQAQLPQIAVVNLAFFQRQFAADNLVARRRIALEFDAPDEELLAFVEIDAQADDLLFVVGFGVRDRREIDVAESGIRLAQVVESFADGFRVEHVAILDLEERAQGRRRSSPPCCR